MELKCGDNPTYLDFSGPFNFWEVIFSNDKKYNWSCAVRYRYNR